MQNGGSSPVWLGRSTKMASRWPALKGRRLFGARSAASRPPYPWYNSASRVPGQYTVTSEGYELVFVRHGPSFLTWLRSNAHTHTMLVTLSSKVVSSIHYCRLDPMDASESVGTNQSINQSSTPTQRFSGQQETNCMSVLQPLGLYQAAWPALTRSRHLVLFLLPKVKNQYANHGAVSLWQYLWR